MLVNMLILPDRYRASLPAQPFWKLGQEPSLGTPINLPLPCKLYSCGSVQALRLKAHG
jgi:hypothetical protein